MSGLNGFVRGDTWRLKLTFKADGAPRDISNWVLTLTMKYDLADATPTLQVSKTVGDDIEDDAPNGVVYLEINSTASAALEPGRYFFDIERRISGTPDNVRTVYPPNVGKDKLTVWPDVG